MAIRLIVASIIFLFSLISFCEGKSVNENKEEFIIELVPIILKAKLELGGDALKIPNSLIIAQAILESNWGNRYPQGNIFGLMSKGRPLKFPSVQQGTVFYLKNLLSHKAYRNFQDKIENGEKSPLVLISSIASAYSGNEEEYAGKIKAIIKMNRLFIFDDLQG